ncbi:hypothetical protein Plhal304r1_c072g0160251 [Plasmopara halstedii]
MVRVCVLLTPCLQPLSIVDASFTPNSRSVILCSVESPKENLRWQSKVHEISFDL